MSYSQTSLIPTICSFLHGNHEMKLFAVAKAENSGGRGKEWCFRGQVIVKELMLSNIEYDVMRRPGNTLDNMCPVRTNPLEYGFLSLPHPIVSVEWRCSQIYLVLRVSRIFGERAWDIRFGSVGNVDHNPNSRKTPSCFPSYVRYQTDRGVLNLRIANKPIPCDEG